MIISTPKSALGLLALALTSSTVRGSLSSIPRASQNSMRIMENSGWDMGHAADNGFGAWRRCTGLPGSMRRISHNIYIYMPCYLMLYLYV